MTQPGSVIGNEADHQMNPASTHFTGFYDQRSETQTNHIKGQSMKDFTRLMSAQTQYQAKVYSQYYIRQPHAVLSLSSAISLNPHLAVSVPQSKPCGVRAIDEYYNVVDNNMAIKSLRNATEFSRIIQLIQ